MSTTYPNSNGTTLSRLLGRKRVRLTERRTPVTTADGKDGELGDNDGGADSGSDFLGGLDTETDVTLAVTDNNDGLEAGTLTGTGLLLDRLDLYPQRIRIRFTTALPKLFRCPSPS